MTQETVGFAAFDIHPNVLMAIIAVGYEEPSPIQAQSIPLILEGYDMIDQAQTDTGKTAVFALPLLSRIDSSRRESQMLVLMPTRKLALRVATVCEIYSKQLPGVGTVAVYGSAPMRLQLKALHQGVQILIATLGCLYNHLRRDEKLLAIVRRLVPDEADGMLELDFMDDLEVIFEALLESRQTVLPSAILPASVCGVTKCHLRQPKYVKIAAKARTVICIEQVHLMVHAGQKADSIQRLLEAEQSGALIAPVRTKQATLDYAELLERQDYHAAVLNGNMPQAQHERIIESLKDGSLDIVIATDIAARGLDIPCITHVLNIDMPYNPESYVHRIGRTGRTGREGRALLLVTPRKRRILQVIERVTGRKVGEIRLPDAKTVLGARLARLAASSTPLLDSTIEQRGAMRDELRRRLGCDVETLVATPLAHLTAGRALDLESVRRGQPLTPSTSRKRVDRGGRGKHSERSDRCRPMAPSSEGHARCRTALGACDGVAAKDLLGVILNEGGPSCEDIGRIQIHDTFSPIGLPEVNLERLLTKLKDIRVAGGALRLHHYREG